MDGEAQQSVFDVDVQQVARVYGKAFLGAAQSAGKVEALVAELGSLVKDVFDRNPQFEELLSSRFIPDTEMIGIIQRTLGSQASPDLITFLKVLTHHGRTYCLRAIQREVDAQYNVLRSRMEVSVRAAGPIDDALRNQIRQVLEKMLNAEPLMTVTTDPTLLGGLVIRVGDTVYDGSVSTRLARLRTQMVERTVEQIEAGREKFLIS